MSNSLLVRRAAVLGAGVMGAQIAAHLTNAGVDTVLFDLAAKEGPADGVVLKAIANQYFTMGILNGLAIVGIAIVFDRTSQAYGRRIQRHLEVQHG